MQGAEPPGRQARRARHKAQETALVRGIQLRQNLQEMPDGGAAGGVPASAGHVGQCRCSPINKGAKVSSKS